MSQARTTSHTDCSLILDVAVHDGPVAIAPLDWPGDCGGEACFLGRTRCQTHRQFGDLLRLEYEVYEPMAQPLMRQMAEQAARQFGCRSVRLVHAHGPVAPSEASVVIQVATPHRGEAFAACRYLIDRLKRELPVWKREIWERGQTFAEGCCAHSHSGSDAGKEKSDG